MSGSLDELCGWTTGGLTGLATVPTHVPSSLSLEASSGWVGLWLNLVRSCATTTARAARTNILKALNMLRQELEQQRQESREHNGETGAGE